MKKEPLMHRLFGFIGRADESKDIINTSHLYMMNMPMPSIKNPSKYDTNSQDYKYL